jgi:8-oxo-dGTP pyrophosphatase MutT (NUDIX family)
MAVEAAKKVFRRELKEKTNILHDKLDKLLDFNK